MNAQYILFIIVILVGFLNSLKSTEGRIVDKLLVASLNVTISTFVSALITEYLISVIVGVNVGSSFYTTLSLLINLLTAGVIVVIVFIPVFALILSLTSFVVKKVYPFEPIEEQTSEPVTTQPQVLSNMHYPVAQNQYPVNQQPQYAEPQQFIIAQPPREVSTGTTGNNVQAGVGFGVQTTPVPDGTGTTAMESDNQYEIEQDNIVSVSVTPLRIRDKQDKKRKLAVSGQGNYDVGVDEGGFGININVDSKVPLPPEHDNSNTDNVGETMTVRAPVKSRNVVKSMRDIVNTLIEKMIEFGYPPDALNPANFVVESEEEVNGTRLFTISYIDYMRGISAKFRVAVRKGRLEIIDMNI